ncbi:hypothetical protein A3743_02730 [Oleiphilus sp. HI0072]|nr:hypothetical protein A3743_02730 [Oleiphilus sp. HI0072]
MGGGGYKDKGKTQLWEEDTLCCVMSVTKAIASLAVLSLADRGIIDLDQPVCTYWTEFAQAGKDKITVRCVLAQLAGVPVADAAPAGSLYQKGVVEQALEVQAPLWPAGSTPCYHSFTHGPLCQALISKCTGQTLGQYLQEEIFGPNNIEFYLGMNESQITRCADIVISNGVPTLQQVNDPNSLLARAWKPIPDPQRMFEDPDFRTHEFGSGNGHSNARNIAKIYSLLSMEGTIDELNRDHRLISKAALEDAIKEQWDGVEVMTHRHFRYGTGFMLNNPYFKTGDNPRSFGHPGLGGAIAFADPDAKISFGYCGNRVHPINETGPCAKALIDALYSCI